jgi:hypothetical protein
MYGNMSDEQKQEIVKFYRSKANSLVILADTFTPMSRSERAKLLHEAHMVSLEVDLLEQSIGEVESEQVS